MNRWMIVVGLSLSVGCASDDALEADAVLGVKDVVTTELDALFDASVALQADAPTPDADGWQGGVELDASKADWRAARVAYERVEGAIAVLFPDLDASTDERYDGFVAEAPDDDLFDGEGVTGVHAVERILWAEDAPAWVVTFEAGLPNYTPAELPADEAQATSYRDALVERLITDVDAMRTGFTPLALEPTAAFDGVVGSMAEQVEKVSLAATGEDESRYAQHTLADMRANLAGGREIYAAFSPWVRAQPDGEALDEAVLAGFERVASAYDEFAGDALPDVPPTWDPDAPSEADLATAYGRLWTVVHAESDPDTAGSLVADMAAAAAAIGLELSL